MTKSKQSVYMKKTFCVHLRYKRHAMTNSTHVVYKENTPEPYVDVRDVISQKINI